MHSNFGLLALMHASMEGSHSGGRCQVIELGHVGQSARRVLASLDEYTHWYIHWY